MEQLDYAGHAYPVQGLGPGQRLVIWVRGCRRQCTDCMTPELWLPGTPAPVAAIAAELQPLLGAADGLTISGGEPFEQASALCELLDLLRHERSLEILAYSGYLIEELAQGDPSSRALLSRLDLLIDGPFIEAMPNTLQWRGSDNQRVHLLSARAQRYAGELQTPMTEPRPLQVQMLPAGRCRLIGIPRRGDLAALARQGILRSSDV